MKIEYTLWEIDYSEPLLTFEGHSFIAQKEMQVDFYDEIENVHVEISGIVHNIQYQIDKDLVCVNCKCLGILTDYERKMIRKYNQKKNETNP